VRRRGHCHLPTNHVEEGTNLWRWVMKRRAEYRGGKLRADRKRQLAALPGWKWRGPA
jgi:hypothetical protein